MKKEQIHPSENVPEPIEAPPLNEEQYVDPHLALLREREASLRSKGKEEMVKEKQKEINTLIEKSLKMKDTGEEPLETGVAFHDIPEHKKAKPAWWKKAMVTLFGAGAIATPHTSEAKSTEDSLVKKNSAIENIAKPADSLKTAGSESPLNLKSYEQFGIARIDPVETSDTTKQVFLISIPEYKSYQDVFRILKKAKLEPSSDETLDEVVDMNNGMVRKSRAIISLKQITNKFGNASYRTITWDNKQKLFIPEAIEIGKDFDSNYEQYRFIVEMPKDTVSYESGIAKK